MDRLEWFLILTGSIVTVAVVILTVSVVAAIRDFRHTLRQARVTLQQAHHLLDQAHGASRHIIRLIDRTCAFATGALDSAAAWKTRAEQWLGPVIGHGNGHSSKSSSIHSRSGH